MPEFQPNEQVVLLCAALAKLGLTEVVVSPGSRSAPLTLALARQSGIRLQTVLDERAAGYIALGKGLVTGQPVALVCTSGTALLNYGPAIAEAYYLRLPLIVLSADRPAAWIDQGDGQSLHQQNVFQGHILAQASLPELIQNDDDRWHVQRLASSLWAKAAAGGPVHLNVPLREPLYALPAPVNLENIKVIKHQAVVAKPEIPVDLVQDWNNAASIWLIAAMQGPDPLFQQAVDRIRQDGRVVFISEPLSNLTSDLGGIDDILRVPGIPMPELLISWGGNLLSKRLKQLLRQHPHIKHWRFDEKADAVDVFQQLQQLWPVVPRAGFEALADLPVKSGDFREKSFAFARPIQERIAESWLELPFSDLSVMRKALEYLPQNIQLHLGNSMPVRYQQFAATGCAAKRWVHANRGTSGIDGVTSTALGAATVSHENVVLITGELSFIYDLNAFSIEAIPANLKVLVLHNGGGDIFRLIDGPKNHPEREKLFATPRAVDVEALATAWGLKLHRATDGLSLSSALKNWWLENQATVLVVYTQAEANQAALALFNQKITTL